MKKLYILIFLLLPFFAHGQQTYFTPGVPPTSTSFTPTFRYIGTDSLVKIFIANGNRSSQVYTAAQANARFGVRGLATSTNYGAFYNTAGKLVLVPGFTTDSGTYFAFNKALYYNAPKTYSTGNPRLVLEGGNKIGLDTTLDAGPVPTNGIQPISPDSIGLGGDLTQGASINLNSQYFELVGINSLFRFDDLDFHVATGAPDGSLGVIDLAPNDFGLSLQTASGKQMYISADTTTGFVIKDDVFRKGWNYNDDYSAQFTDNSLISRKASIMIADSVFTAGIGRALLNGATNTLTAPTIINTGASTVFEVNGGTGSGNESSLIVAPSAAGLNNQASSTVGYGVSAVTSGPFTGANLGYENPSNSADISNIQVDENNMYIKDTHKKVGLLNNAAMNFVGGEQLMSYRQLDSIYTARTGAAGYEVTANKATSFSTLNNTLYPTTQAVANYALAKTNNLSDLSNDSTSRVNLGVSYAKTTDNANALSVTNLGDSMTAGYGGSPGWVADLQTTLAPRGFVFANTGVGGQTSTQIAVRAGCVTTTATVVGGSIPASGGVTVTFPTGYDPVTSQGPSGGTYGSILGIPGLVTLSTGVYTFTRTTAGSITSVSSAPFVVVPPNLSGPVTIWVGRNNFTNPTQVIADIDSIVAHKSAINNKYVIYTILNATSEPVGTTNYNDIIALNATIMSRYSGHAFDLRTYLVVATGNDPTGIINTSYKFDDVHLNTAGYQLVANYTLTSAVWSALTGGSQGGAINVNNINQWFNYNPITGPSGVSSFTSTTSLGLKISGANGPTNYEGIDFVNSTSANPLLPYARIAAIAGTTGSVLSLGTTNNYAQGVNNQGLNIGPNADVSIGGTTFLGSKFTITPNTTSATNISRFLYGNPTALGATLGSYQYLDELQNNNSGSSIDRFQRAFYRRVAGTGFQGTEMRMQYAVDNSFTTGGLAYMGLGADVSGNGTIFMGTNGTDMMNITSAAVNITGPLAVTSSTFTAKNFTLGASSNAGFISFVRGDGAIGAYGGYRHTSPTTTGDFVIESDGGGATLTLNAGTVDVLKVTSTGVTLPLFTTAGILHTQVTTGLLSSSLVQTADLASSLSLTTPNINVATATSINKVAITAPATAATITIANGATLQQTGAFTLNNTLTANSTPTYPTGAGTLLYNPLTTTGDIMYSSSGATASRLGIGSTNQILTVSGGLPTWVTPTIIIQGTADLTAQTAAGNITTFTVGASTATFNVSAYINVTAVTTDVIQAQVTYTDENNTAQTVSFTTLSTISNSTYSPVTIRAKNGTVITVKTNLTTGVGSITFDAGARIIQN